MANTEILLETLIVPELQRLKETKFDFYGISTEVPKGQSWSHHDSITLEKFLEQHPLPKKGEDIALFGIAWELVWGMETPQKITDTKEGLIIKARTGMSVTKNEELWLKLMSVDTDMF